MTSVTPALSGIKRQLGEIGEAKVKALLNILVGECVIFFSVGKMMGAAQVIETVKLILEEFWMLKPEDFKLCFNNAKKGHYGKVYDRVDGNVILDWLRTYTEERIAYAENKNDQQHDKVKSDINQKNYERQQVSEAERIKFTEAMRQHILDQNKKSA